MQHWGLEFEVQSCCKLTPASLTRLTRPTSAALGTSGPRTQWLCMQPSWSHGDAKNVLHIKANEVTRTATWIVFSIVKNKSFWLLVTGYSRDFFTSLVSFTCSFKFLRTGFICGQTPSIYYGKYGYVLYIFDVIYSALDNL
jgi:hypothetical protein